MPPISEFSDHVRGCRVRYVLYPGKLRMETRGLLVKRQEYEQQLRGVQPQYNRVTLYSQDYLLYLGCALLTLFGAIFLGFNFYKYAFEEAGYVLAFGLPSVLLLLFFVFVRHFLVALTRRRLEMAVFLFEPNRTAFVVRRLMRDPAEFDGFLEQLAEEIKRSNYSLGDRAEE